MTFLCVVGRYENVKKKNAIQRSTCTNAVLKKLKLPYKVLPLITGYNIQIILFYNASQCVHCRVINGSRVG